EHRPEEPRARMPKDMSPNEIADRIVAKLLQGSGPILLCVPGTLGGAYESSMLAIAREFVHQAQGPVSVASIPYPNGVLDVATRYFGIGTEEAKNVLALVLQRLVAAAPGRPILLTGESQGAWLISDTLRDDPKLAAAVTRVAIFAKPGFVHMPTAIGSARLGASLLPATVANGSSVIEYRHTDDIVPSLFSRLRPGVFTPYLDSLLHGRGLEYPPHHYDWHGEEAARFLLTGAAPTSPLVHRSSSHPMHADHI
ncbi:MAG: hypothetical protein KDC46_13805, partial [Thermoleophilia bacterium]|nr:hypothetical protein [Thermoleophilia bacterium]